MREGVWRTGMDNRLSMPAAVCGAPLYTERLGGQNAAQSVLQLSRLYLNLTGLSGVPLLQRSMK